MHRMIGYTAALWCAAALSAAAQTTGSITGRVTDRNGKPLPGATIKILGTSPLRGAVSKMDGSYLIAGVRTGDYRVAVSVIGHASDTIAVRVSVDQTTTVAFRLAPPENVVDKPTEIVRKGKVLPADSSAPHTIVAPTPWPGYSGINGFSIRGTRGGSLVVRRQGMGYVMETAPIRPEARLIDIPARPAGRGMSTDSVPITAAPVMSYRPALAWPRDFVRIAPYGSYSDPSVSDPFAGNFGGSGSYYPYYIVHIATTTVPEWSFDPDTRDVVEPSIRERAAWIERYEERRDHMSAYERMLASWTRPR